ncbi:MAG TPA: ATP-binding protein [Kofleriaceae bacterium]|jgi:hypothetical protein
MHLSSPALRTPPVVVAQPFVALLSNGTLLARDGNALLFGGSRIEVTSGVASAAVVSGQVWCVACDGTLHRYTAAGVELGTIAIGAADHVSITGTTRGPRAALVESSHGSVLVREENTAIALTDLGARGSDRRLLIGTRVAERQGANLRLGAAVLAIPYDLSAAHVGASAVVLDDSTLVVEMVGTATSTVVMYSMRTLRVTSRVRIGHSRVAAVADRAGVLVIARENHIALLDLRAGRCTAERILNSAVAACAIDELGVNVAIVDAAGNTIRLGRALTDAVGSPDAGTIVIVEDDSRDASASEGDTSESEGTAANAGTAATGTAVTDTDSTALSATPALVLAAVPADSATTPTTVSAPTEREANDPLASLYLHALGAPRAEALSSEELADYLATVHAWVEGTCAVAITKRRGEANDSYRAGVEKFSAWQRRGAPHVELAHELGLSPMAATVLLLIAAPQIWCDLARTYALVAADGSRPLVDELLIATLLEAGIDEQAALARELDADAPLVRTGAVMMATSARPCAALSVPSAIARRLTGTVLAPSGAGESWGIDFADLVGPRDAVLALAHSLEEPRATSPRIVLRGKAGSGRRTIARLLAARADRAVAVATIQGDLAAQLREIVLRGHVPVIDLAGLPSDDAARRASVGAAIDAHAGPLFVRAEPDAELPFTPTESVDLPVLTESERAACWRSHLDNVDAADALAARYAIGPGAIARAAATADPIASLRASRGLRIARLADRVERLASWDDLVVTDDVGDAMRELIARARFRRTVLETWGMGEVATTSRGITALFQGGPGTGKTMAAGVIARALGYELWRVDLSKVVSKWIGETERNLAALFDAAEEGEIVLLFDEADALFTKRTEVKSSNDKHANAATNYLLQRIDSFTGIAILTTNFGTAIDPAFRRRLSVQVEFPFPDEEERLRLWRAHLPRALPTSGDLQLDELARTYELSGGYIRNAALRAAYLAAGRSSSPVITADDLRRAVALEKERVGKLGNGRIE